MAVEVGGGGVGVEVSLFSSTLLMEMCAVRWYNHEMQCDAMRWNSILRSDNPSL